MEFFNTLIHGRKGYPPDVKRILERHGNERITYLELRKYPIDKNINVLLNTIVAMHGKAVPFEKLFHLSMFCKTDAGTDLLIEKNYVFHMEVNPRDVEHTQRMEVPIHDPKPVIEMLERTKEEMGEGNFFGYSSKDNNCQDWTLAFMNANLLNTPEYQEFIKQDVEKSMEGLVDLRKFLNSMTDTARWFDILKQGGAELSKQNGLTNFDIDHLLRDVSTYQGCYPKDKLPHDLKRGCWYVVNMQDAADGDGTHWVCFKYGYPVCYYDPFGIAPPIEIMKICKRQLVWNGKQIQDENSTACGWFCVACILSDYKDNHRDTLTHFNRFVNSFSENTKVNDKILKKMISYYSHLTPN